MRDDIYVRLSRPEGYEDVHPDLVLEDARIEPAFEPVGVTDEIERLLALLREVAQSGVEFEDARVDYVAVQIDRETWEALVRLDALLGGRDA